MLFICSDRADGKVQFVVVLCNHHVLAVEEDFPKVKVKTCSL